MGRAAPSSTKSIGTIPIAGRTIIATIIGRGTGVITGPRRTTAIRSIRAGRVGIITSMPGDSGRRTRTAACGIAAVAMAIMIAGEARSGAAVDRAAGVMGMGGGDGAAATKRRRVKSRESKIESRNLNAGPHRRLAGATCASWLDSLREGILASGSKIESTAILDQDPLAQSSARTGTTGAGPTRTGSQWPCDFLGNITSR